MDRSRKTEEVDHNHRTPRRAAKEQSMTEEDEHQKYLDDGREQEHAEEERLLPRSLLDQFDQKTTGENPLPLEQLKSETGYSGFCTALDDDQLTALFIACQRRKRVVDAELKELEILSKVIQGSPDQPGLIDRFIAKGIDKITKHGATVHFYRQLWARKHREPDEGPEADDAVRARAIAALKALPSGQAFVREDFNVTSLSAYFREQKKDAESRGEQWAPPAALAGAIDVVEDVQLRIRNSK